MKREQRRPWLAAAGRRYILCALCRFGEAVEGDILCRHSIELVTDRYGIEPGDDCWRFRPERGLTLEAAAARVAEWDAEEVAREAEGLRPGQTGFLELGTV